MIRLGYEAYVYPAKAIEVTRYSYVPYIFSTLEIQKLFSACDNYSHSKISPNRHYVLQLIMRMLYGCGLRISEAVNLTVDDVKLGEGVLFINDTKFGKERLVPEVIV
ncbi:MAG: tyrosine-type recombinase/integrase [Alkaliphilus sp.]